MPRLGILECNRCKVKKLQDEAAKRNMVITMRKSLYGLKPNKKGVDIYIHPKSLEIPSHHIYEHNLDIGRIEAMTQLLDDSDPDKWFEAWLPDIPQGCECRNV
jgi:hypothetical protein